MKSNGHVGQLAFIHEHNPTTTAVQKTENVTSARQIYTTEKSDCAIEKAAENARSLLSKKMKFVFP